jgi:hypothetical protein
MSAHFINRLFERLCPHRFSWPHSGVDGQDYQVCLICGAVFGYDWNTMRRTGPLVSRRNAGVTPTVGDDSQRHG